MPERLGAGKSAERPSRTVSRVWAMRNGAIVYHPQSKNFKCFHTPQWYLAVRVAQMTSRKLTGLRNRARQGLLCRVRRI